MLGALYRVRGWKIRLYGQITSYQWSGVPEKGTYAGNRCLGTTKCARGPAPCRAEAGPPITLADGLLDHNRPDTLGLDPAPGAEIFTIFRPGPDDPRYNHGVVLFPFKGRLYARWQASARDEDAPDTHVIYTRSDDGSAWSAPRVLAESPEHGIRTPCPTARRFWSATPSKTVIGTRWRSC